MIIIFISILILEHPNWRKIKICPTIYFITIPKGKIWTQKASTPRILYFFVSLIVFHKKCVFCLRIVGNIWDINGVYRELWIFFSGWFDSVVGGMKSFHFRRVIWRKSLIICQRRSLFHWIFFSEFSWCDRNDLYSPVVCWRDDFLSFLFSTGKQRVLGARCWMQVDRPSSMVRIALKSLVLPYPYCI